MKNKIIEFSSFILIVLLILVMTISSIKITYRTFSLKTYSFCLIIFGIVGIIIYIISKIKNFKFKKYEIFIFILMILTSLSLITSIDINVSLYGKANRYEGYFAIMTYYILILNGMNIKNKKYLIVIVTMIAMYSIINIFYGLFQTGLLNTFLFNIKNKWYFARGFVGNSMFYSTIMAIFYPLVLGMFIKMEINIKKLLCLFILAFATIGIIISGAMSAFVAICFIFIIIFIDSIIAIIKKNKDGVYYLIYFFVSIIIFAYAFIMLSIKIPNLKMDLSETVSEASSIQEGVIKDNFGTGRVYIWKNTINKIIEYKGVGVGIDNFYNAFNGRLIDTKSRLPVDKAHNDYLQKILCEGLLSGIVFIIFLLSIFFKLIFKKIPPIYYGLFLSFTSYSIQAFFNISVTRVAPIYFVIIGLLISKYYEIVSSNNSCK